MKNKNKWIALAAGAMFLADAALRAATLTLSTTAPTPGTNDIYNFSGASHEGANVGDGGAYADGPANDAFTYVAGDRADQGQTFTTAATPAAVSSTPSGRGTPATTRSPVSSGTAWPIFVPTSSAATATRNTFFHHGFSLAPDAGDVRNLQHLQYAQADAASF
jgi:hypothetical protein